MLVAVDTFEHSEGAVRHAIDMARRISDACVVLVNVQPPAMSGEVSALVSAEEVMAQHTEAGHRLLEKAKALLAAHQVPYEAEIVIGTPAEGIVECAARRGCDIIIVGASSHGRVHSLVLGSVAAKIARMADIPVTVVK
jgi:nucleotide-binding universal stress UspA family protein